MMIASLRISLLFMMLVFSCGTTANFSQHTDYYLSQNSTLLSKIETFHLQQALYKLKEREYSHAWSELGFVLHYFPNHPIALMHLGEISYITGHAKQAAQYFERALALYPDHGATYHLYGQFLMQDEKYVQAIAQFKKAILLDKNVADYHYHLSLAYIATRHYSSAKKEAHLANLLGANITVLQSFLKDPID